MNGEYKIFRIFCIFSVAVLCVLLVTTGILTAKNQTEQAVFGERGDVIQIYENSGGAVINLNGKISDFDIHRIDGYFDTLSNTLLSPVNNVIKLAGSLTAIIRQR